MIHIGGEFDPRKVALPTRTLAERVGWDLRSRLVSWFRGRKPLASLTTLLA